MANQIKAKLLKTKDEGKFFKADKNKKNNLYRRIQT
jgi:hypothetical protein